MRCLYKQNNDYLKRQNAFWLNKNKKLWTNQGFKSFILSYNGYKPVYTVNIS